MSFEYIRKAYGVPARRGGFVKVEGKPGRITSASGAYLMIKLQGEKRPKPYHPTWEMEYFATEKFERK